MWAIRISHIALVEETNPNGIFDLDLDFVSGLDSFTIASRIQEGQIFERVFWSGELQVFHNTGVSVSQGVMTNFTAFRKIIQSVKRCSPIEFYISQINTICENPVKYDGLIFVRDLEICHHSCKVNIKSIEPNDLYRCLFKYWKDNVNIESLPTVKVRASPKGSYVKTELKIKSIDSEDAPEEYNPYQDFAPIENSEYWFIKDTEVSFNASTSDAGDGTVQYDDAFTYVIRTTWHREVIGLPFGSDAPTGWQLLYSTADSFFFYRNPPKLAKITLHHGRRLSEVLVFAFKSAMQSCFEGIEVYSHLLNIGNPPYSYNANPVYAIANTDLKNVTIHAQSDVKRPDASPPARGISYDMTLEKLTNDLKVLHNVYWSIDYDDDVPYIKVEHLSQFRIKVSQPIVNASEFVQDITQALHSDYCIGYDKIPLFRKESFEFLDGDNASNKDSFLGQPITYAPSCTEGEDLRKCLLFNADPENYIIYDSVGNIGHSALNSGRVVYNQDKSDKGFIILQNDIVGGDLVIGMRNALDEPIFNGAYTWRYLHENYHRWGRVLKNGNMNGQATVFQTWLSYLKSSPVKLKMCCSGVIDINNPFRTVLSNMDAYTLARAESITFYASANNVEIDLRYAFENE